MRDDAGCSARAVAMVAALDRGEVDAVAPIVIVVAHPDDEVVSAGSILLRFGGYVSLIHVTNGSPRNLADAHAAGFETGREYADARLRELNAALEIAGIGPERCFFLDLPDQEAGFSLVETTERITALLESLDPRLVLTHPYEGGHPDHDAAAFAVHAAVRPLFRQSAPPVLAEFASYHSRDGEMSPLEFLPAPGCLECVVELSPWERERKVRMMRCFATQQAMIGQFPVYRERYRPAPAYDFTRPPHPGKLFYEGFDWGMTGERWCTLARAALDSLGMEVLP